MKRLLLVFLMATGLGLRLSPTVFAVIPPPTITQQPADQTVPVGGTAAFSVSLAPLPNGNVSWKVSTDGGSTYTFVSDSSTYSGSSTTTLTVKNVPAAFNGYSYFAIVFDATNTNSATSTTALLTVTSPPPSPAPTPTPPSQNVNTASRVAYQFLLNAYMAHQAGTGSLLTLECAYLAYLNIQDALHFDAVGNLAARESSGYQAAVFAYYGVSLSATDVSMSGSADARNANQFAIFTLYFSYQVFLGN